MSMKDYQRGRNDGLALAAKVVKKGGPEALAEEIKVRGVTGIHTNLSCRELDEALQPIKELTFRTMLTMSVATLMDEFGFGKKRLERFRERFEEKVVCLGGGWVTWKDICEDIEKSTGIQIVFEGMPDTSKEEGGNGNG